MIYPIGRQNFENLRNDGCVYVDKTALMYKLVKEGSVYFMSRPRRFGKSLLLSTLEAYFTGKKELFKGLAIEQLEKDWFVHPVLHLDLNAKKFDKAEDLYDILNAQLYCYEQQYESVSIDSSIEGRFRAIIRAAKEKTGRNVVVLIDEYDKPILQAIGNAPLQEEFRNTLKAFYGVLKSADADLKFALLTGVTKFGKVSVFSDLNNLNDISMDTAFHNLCGITDEELHNIFDDEIQLLADNNGQTKEEAYATLKRNYDGYHFDRMKSCGIYNPFSVLNTLSKRTYGSYWFNTGTPTYLVELIKKADFNIEELSNYVASEDQLNSIHVDDIDPIPVLYQSGYLTITEYDKEFGLYTLNYPNEEVKSGFINFLLPFYSKVKEKQAQTIISTFVTTVRSGKAEKFMQQLQSLMAGTPYELIRDLENHYQNVMYIITKLMGLYVQAEYRTINGRIDLLIGTKEYLYIIELKFNGTAEQALEQIHNKEYSLPFEQQGRTIIKIGANVSPETRNIEKWIIE